MHLNARLRFLVTTIALWLMVQGLPLSVSESWRNTEFQIGTEALAKRSGGRSRGGSFGSSSGSRSTSGSRSRSRGSSSSGGSSSSTPALKKTPTSGSSASQSSPNVPSSSSTGGRVRGGSFAPSPAPPPPPPHPSAPPPARLPVHSAPPPPRPMIPVPIPVPIPGDRRPVEEGMPRSDPPPAPLAPPPPSSHLQPSEPLNSAPPPGHYRPDPGITGAVYASGRTAPSNWMGFMLGLLILGGALFIAYLIFSRRSPSNELENDRVTVSKLQVALLTPEGDLQEQLTQLTLNGDTESNEGLVDMLQEGALALMRRSDRWCYVASSSQTVNSREEAQQLFEKLSLQERSKFTSETLVNVNGAVQERLAALSQELSEPGSYVVVTLLVGTADDQPLFKDIHTAQALRETLGRLGSISPEYLMVFELLWSPQEESASLSSDELLTSYSQMIPI
ncbi:DUF1517 domain-containing protein [Roseofilum sp. BLCC_M154]|uniref:DUF1517 domain-containing protein n=1 Tax=Roseofilum acuticapitatum BLCC-M154 TaxID=3022444 RepID=A0ABT7ALU3_9CYAN|nr:DUF1517 domain-containing protein [Roseofilum acuticapitatum]MDJ1167864.1 DUF1517 domain-containing protein [Roseofilum acuticapitatum BLCC-M154]